MRIAIGKKSGSGLRFDVDIPGLAPFPLDLARNAATGQNQPDWIASYRGERCGAFWKKTPRQGGEDFLSGSIESPAFAGGRLEVAIFHSKQTAGQKDMTWRPRLEEKSGGSERATSSSSESAPASQSDGSDRGGEDDDDIPF